jgi:DNA-binding transcriptional ArsR family regulator
VKPLTDITDPSLVKALAHPLRVRILSVLESRTASPSEISQQLGASLGTVSYHVRQLAQLGLIELVKVTPRRGAVEHHYRANARQRITDDAWNQVPEIVKQAMIGSALGQIGELVNEAAQTGGFSADGAHLSRMPLVLDRRGWRELSRELSRMVERIERIHRQSGERLIESDHADEQRATAVMMLFGQVEAAEPGRRRRAAPRQRSEAATRRA